eukprot:1160373-Pelagomonas_calceolata.AAC.13
MCEVRRRSPIKLSSHATGPLPAPAPPPLLSPNPSALQLPSPSLSLTPPLHVPSCWPCPVPLLVLLLGGDCQFAKTASRRTRSASFALNCSQVRYRTEGEYMRKRLGGYIERSCSKATLLITRSDFGTVSSIADPERLAG